MTSLDLLPYQMLKLTVHAKKKVKKEKFLLFYIIVWLFTRVKYGMVENFYNLL